MSRKNPPVAPKAALGRLKEIRVDLGMFDNTVICVVGPYSDLPAYVAWKHESPGAANLRCWSPEPKGAYEYSHGHKPIVWIPRKPRTPAEFGTLAHELLHAIRAIMQDWAGIHFDRDTQEVYCHAIGFCMAEVLTALSTSNGR